MSDEWVLVPKDGAHNDCPMYDAFWRTKAEYERWVKAEVFPRPTLPAAMWKGLLAARPPIPRAVWDKMVEKGAEAAADFEYGQNTFASWKESGNHNALANWRLRANRTLFAALNNPEVADE